MSRFVAMLTVVAFGLLSALSCNTAWAAADAPVPVSASGPLHGGSVQVGPYLLYVGPGAALWRTDGTPDGTVQVRDPATGGPTGAVYLVSTGSLAFFQGEDATHGKELWQSDGTSAGTVLVSDIRPGTDDSRPSYLTAIGNTVYFDAYTPPNGIDALWKSTGVGGSTTEVKMINAVNSSFSNPVNLNGELLFTATDGATHGIELWKSDGTSDTTVMVKDIASGGTTSDPRLLTVCGGRVWFRANDGAHGTELWSSDGSTNGTQLVADINPGNASSTPNSVACLGSDVYFDANDGTHGDELWKSTGPNSAALVADTVPGSAGGAPSALTVAGGSLFFTDNTAAAGRELWHYTPGGSAAQVGDINPGTGNADVQSMTAVGSSVYFSASDGTTGAELWTSDGGSVSLVGDIDPGIDGSHPFDLTSFGGSLYFGAQDSSAGDPKLWRVGPAPAPGGATPTPTPQPTPTPTPAPSGANPTPPATTADPAPPATATATSNPPAAPLPVLPPTAISPTQLAQYEVESVTITGGIGFVTVGPGATGSVAKAAEAARAKKAKTTFATTALRCTPVKGAPFTTCAGTLSFSLAKKGCTGTVKPPKRGSLLLAKTRYSIPAGRQATVKAPLAGTGLKLVKGKRYCIAISVSATSGKATKTRTLLTRSQKF